MDSLAVVESDPATFAAAIETAALHDGTAPADREMFVRIDDDCVETPASGAGAQRASYCTIDGDRFDRLAVTGGTVDAMFDIAAVLSWLEWVDGDRLTARFEGQAGIASRLTLSSNGDEVGVACVDDPAVLDSVETYLPDRFDDTTFLDEAGTPLPTTVETTAGELSRLVDAVDLAAAPEAYPLAVREGGLAVNVEGDSATVSASLDTDVAGPDVTNRYGEGFAAVVRGIDGDVTLQTGPGEPVAFVQKGPTHTLRFVVSHE
jgi:hypothetical protein